MQSEKSWSRSETSLQTAHRTVQRNPECQCWGDSTYGICSSGSCCTYRTCSQPRPCREHCQQWELLAHGQLLVASTSIPRGSRGEPCWGAGWGSSILWDTAQALPCCSRLNSAPCSGMGMALSCSSTSTEHPHRAAPQQQGVSDKETGFQKTSQRPPLCLHHPRAGSASEMVRQQQTTWTSLTQSE